MHIRVLGSGDAFGSGGRFNTCIHLSAGGSQVLVDFGASSMVAMGRFGVRAQDIDAIVITHLHGDHFGGLPFLLLYEHHAGKRERPLLLAGPPGLERRVGEALEALFSSITTWRFPLEFVEIAPGRREEVAGLSVEPFPVAHSADPTYALRVESEGKVFAYSSDTSWTDVLTEVARDADLFLMECYSYDKEVPAHANWMTIKRHLPDLRAKRVMLTHMSEAMLERLDEVSVEVAEDGLEVTL